MDIEDRNVYLQRLNELGAKIAQVRGELEGCDGYILKAGEIDIGVAGFFMEYLDWEINHIDVMERVLIGNDVFADNSRGDVKKTDINLAENEGERRAKFHIEYELDTSMEILADAQARIKAGKQFPYDTGIDWNNVSYDNGYFREGDKPVFSGGFNLLAHSYVDTDIYPEWVDRSRQSTNDFLKEMKSIGVGIISDRGIPIMQLIKADGTVDKIGVQKIVDELLMYRDMGFKCDTLFSWRGNTQVLEKLWPGITKYDAHGIGLDIDHPGAKELIQTVIAEIIPKIRKTDAVLSIDMANEPVFSFDMWSEYTLASYRIWLKELHGDIQSLNRAWQTDYSDFFGIPMPSEKPYEECSAGEWYDRVTYHSIRTANFFGFMAAEIRKYMPEAILHLKGQDNTSLGPRPFSVTSGIDREMLSNSTSMQGVDTRPLPITEPRMAAGDDGYLKEKGLNYDASSYGYHWLGQSFLYDYLTSLKPSQPIIDFEYHAFSINAIRIPNISRRHAGASLWMAHLHGLLSNVTWYWHRRYGPDPFSNKNFEMWLYGSISTQPSLAAEYFHTLLKMNIFAREIEALASCDERPVRIFVSKPSYIQNQSHIAALHRVYEGICFYGLRIGFVTEQILLDEGISNDCRLLIMPDAEYVSKSALSRLKEASDDGLNIIRFGDIVPKYNEYGQLHREEMVGYFKDLKSIQHKSAYELANDFKELLSPFTKSQKVEISVVGDYTAFGIMHRQVEFEGHTIVFLSNVLPENAHVQLRCKNGDNINGYDILSAEVVNCEKIELCHQGVRIIRID